ncbi:unnamed protein product [Closterium sp. NIES-54]
MEEGLDGGGVAGGGGGDADVARAGDDGGGPAWIEMGVGGEIGEDADGGLENKDNRNKRLGGRRRRG